MCYNRGLTYDRYEWFPIGKVRAEAQLAAVALQLAPEPSIRPAGGCGVFGAEITASILVLKSRTHRAPAGFSWCQQHFDNIS